MSTRRADTPKTRADFLSAEGVLLVVRDAPPAAAPVPGQPAAVPGNPAEGPEILLAIWDDGSITGLNGHVDLGTGLATALAQIVAEELDAPLSQVRMVLGDTARAPNQGATIASAPIQIQAVPLRRAAAQARAWLVAQAAEHFGVMPSLLEVRDGRIHAGEGHAIGIGELVAGGSTVLHLAADTPVKGVED